MKRSADTLYDAVIVGGGPAGAAAALTLAEAGRRVLLLEQRTRIGFKLGESIPPQVRPLVERLLGAANLAATELTDPRNQTHGNVSCWGSDQPQAQSFFFMPHRYGLRLDRPRFDQALRQRALAAGVDVRMGSALRRAEAGVADGARWRCTVTAGDTAAADDTILARMLLDCSGRRASVARGRGVRRHCGDRLFAFARCYLQAADASADDDTQTHIEAVADGWWYSVRLPATGAERCARRLVVFHTDRDLPAARQAAQATGFDHQLGRSQHIRGILREHGYPAQAAGAIHGAAAGSEYLQHCVGHGWLAVGDAAQAFDPLSSQGIGSALTAGLTAAAAVDQTLAGDLQALHRYQAGLEAVRSDYQRQHRYFYAAERRWPEHPFWQRRQRPVVSRHWAARSQSPVVSAHSS